MRVSFERVTKRFGPHTVLRDIDLEVESGECLVLLGPSGCGKTTLLRLAAGLERVDAGRIHIGPRVVNDLPPAARDVAMVFQNYALYPNLTVYENIAFPLVARRVGAAETRRRVLDVAERLELGPCLDRRPGQLSGGQQQRVALARAIVRNPAVYLMDEPLSNLDAQLRVQTRSELKRLQHELGTTTIYVTHDQEEAMTLGRRVAILRGGAIEQVGAPLDLYRDPANRFVAGFLGSPALNLWPGTLADGDEVEAAGARFRVGSAVRARLAAAVRFEVGVRPEDVQLATEPRDGWAGARVLVVEPLGRDTIVTLQSGGARIVARAGGAAAAEAGERLWFTVDPDRALFFDASSGARIAGGGEGPGPLPGTPRSRG
jgi:multiple sugar transport system ATP-binding protein